jgi:hypothetical protein
MSKQTDDKGQTPIADSTRNSELNGALGVEPVTAYQCKCCKTLYATEQAANNCAGKHRTNLRIADTQYDRERKLPCTITIEFTEGLTTYQHDYHYD